CEIGSGTRGDIEDAAEAIAIFRRESAGHQVHGFENLRANSSGKLRLRVVEKRDAVDELVQREFRATHSQKIVVAVACAGHQVVDQVVGALHQGIRQALEILPRKSVRAAGFLRINSQIAGRNFHGLANGFLFLQLNIQRNGLAGPQHKVISGDVVAGGLDAETVGSGLDGRDSKLSIRVRDGGQDGRGVGVSQGDGGVRDSAAGIVMNGALNNRLGKRRATRKQEEKGNTQEEQTNSKKLKPLIPSRQEPENT